VRLYMIAAERGILPQFPEPSHSASDERLLPWASIRECLERLPVPDEQDIVRPSGRRAMELLRLKPGTGLKSIGIVEANRPSGHWGYRQDCFRADESLPSRTIRAASTPDWIVDADGMRRLTWRECAALQDFPADWTFCGSAASRFRQIGNAVQGHVGLRVAHMLGRAAADAGDMALTSPPWPGTFHRRVSYTAAEDRVNGWHREMAKRASPNAERRRASV
jgi:DNA (cytosine-5)-methyltransferase 1